MRGRNIIRNQQGFTLIEIIAVLILLGILAAVAVPKYMDLTEEAKNKGVDAAIAELNSRETMVWGKVKLAAAPPTTDAAMDTAVLAEASYSTVLGADYVWTTAASATGGVLNFKVATTGVTLTRTAATLTSPAKWART